MDKARQASDQPPFKRFAFASTLAIPGGGKMLITRDLGLASFVICSIPILDSRFVISVKPSEGIGNRITPQRNPCNIVHGRAFVLSRLALISYIFDLKVLRVSVLKWR